RRDHIAILMDNDASFPSLMIATSMVGAVLIPINSMLTRGEVEYNLTQSDTKYLILQEMIEDKQHGKAVKELMSTTTFQEKSALDEVISIKIENENPKDKRYLFLEDILNGA